MITLKHCRFTLIWCVYHISKSLYLSVSLSHSLCLSLSLSLSLSVSISRSISLSICLHLFRSFPLSHSLSFSSSFPLPVSYCLAFDFFFSSFILRIEIYFILFLFSPTGKNFLTRQGWIYDKKRIPCNYRFAMNLYFFPFDDSFFLSPYFLCILMWWAMIQFDLVCIVFNNKFLPFIWIWLTASYFFYLNFY